MLLDWLGSALAGCATAPGATLLAYGDAEPEGGATVIGGKGARSAETAAFVNGALSHIVEMDSAVLRGDAGLGAFGEDSIRDSRIRELTSKVHARIEGEIEARYPAEWPARVRVCLANGATLDAETRYPKGDPENPLSRTEIEEKFSTLAAFGGFEGASNGFREWVRSLPRLATVRLP